MDLLAGAGTDFIGTDSLITDSVGTEPIGNGRVLTKDTENIDELIKTTKPSCFPNRLINCIPNLAQIATSSSQ
jgi:hypothetical protein